MQPLTGQLGGGGGTSVAGLCVCKRGWQGFRYRDYRLILVHPKILDKTNLIHVCLCVCV